ncbi:MAG: hypothetical protein KDK66_01190 [Deltaproteobacteria bacterium]|nr:hypothetical protein [Deltaproteobacteria bacterium]
MGDSSQSINMESSFRVYRPKLGAPIKGPIDVDTSVQPLEEAPPRELNTKIAASTKSLGAYSPALAYPGLRWSYTHFRPYPGVVVESRLTRLQYLLSFGEGMPQAYEAEYNVFLYQTTTTHLRQRLEPKVAHLVDWDLFSVDPNESQAQFNSRGQAANLLALRELLDAKRSEFEPRDFNITLNELDNASHFINTKTSTYLAAFELYHSLSYETPEGRAYLLTPHECYTYVLPHAPPSSRDPIREKIAIIAGQQQARSHNLNLSHEARLTAGQMAGLAQELIDHESEIGKWLNREIPYLERLPFFAQRRYAWLIGLSESAGLLAFPGEIAGLYLEYNEGRLGEMGDAFIRGIPTGLAAGTTVQSARAFYHGRAWFFSSDPHARLAALERAAPYAESALNLMAIYMIAKGSSRAWVNYRQGGSLTGYAAASIQMTAGGLGLSTVIKAIGIEATGASFGLSLAITGLWIVGESLWQAEESKALGQKIATDLGQRFNDSKNGASSDELKAQDHAILKLVNAHDFDENSARELIIQLDNQSLLGRTFRPEFRDLHLKAYYALSGENLDSQELACRLILAYFIGDETKIKNASLAIKSFNLTQLQYATEAYKNAAERVNQACLAEGAQACLPDSFEALYNNHMKEHIRNRWTGEGYPQFNNN